MQMVRQNHNGIDSEGKFNFHAVESTAEQIDRFTSVKEVLALVGDDCEEVGCSRSFGTAALHELTHNLKYLGWVAGE